MAYRTFVILIFFGLSLVASAQQQDIRDRYGTRSLEAASYMHQGLEHSNKKHYAAALRSFQNACRVDPAFSLARYWVVVTQGELGNIGEAVKAYQEVVAIDEKARISNVTIDACVNLALLYCDVDKHEDAAVWFTKAIMLDPEDKFKLAWKAYRNMAITLHERGETFSAMMCAILGYKAEGGKERVGLKMVKDYLKDVDDDEEVCQVLHFPYKTPLLKASRAEPRMRTTKLNPPIANRVSKLLLDIKKNRIIVLTADKQSYYVIDAGGGNKVSRVRAPGAITAACCIAGKFYVAIHQPASLLRLSIPSGRILDRWNLPKAAPASLAVLPSQDLAIFPLGSILHTYDLTNRRLTKTDFGSTGVVADPLQRFCYSYVHPGRKNVGVVIIDGRPVVFDTGSWLQTSLFKYAVAKRQPQPAAFRINAASNGRQICLSADGNWISIVGGGGWRPQDGSRRGGYGIAVFSAMDIKRLVGFFPTGAYPEGMAINHITNHIVVFNKKSLSLYHLADPSTKKEAAGSFGRAAIWSADGRWLFIAGQEKGVACYELKRNAVEVRAGAAWADKFLKQSPLAKGTGSPRRPLGEKLAQLENFKVRTRPADAMRALDNAIDNGRSSRPVKAFDNPAYVGNAMDKSILVECNRQINGTKAGVAIYRLREFLKKNPKNPLAKQLLGIGYYKTRQLDKVEPLLLDAIHADAGATDVTIESLRCLAWVYSNRRKLGGAIYCVAHALLLDKSNQMCHRDIRTFAEKAGVSKRVETRLKRIKIDRISSDIGGGELPVLKEPRKRISKYSASSLFRKAAESVVVIRTRRGNGSGVCVAEDGYILTNLHVIGEGATEVQVIPYSFKGRKLKQLKACEAKVIFRSAESDLAVVKVEDPPDSLEPLDIAENDPEHGDKVYALGSPGLGKEILDQSLSDGIVSSPSRKVEGLDYIQHTAAINPGNSGGPLLDRYCQIAGINTLKARLENVGFAIPASRIRKIFPKRK